MLENKLLDKYLKDEKEFKPKKILTKVLICLIILFSALIAVEVSPEASKIIKKYVYETNFDFAGFQSFYEKIAGKSKSEKTQEAEYVMAGTLEYTSSEKYLDGYKLSGLSSNSLMSLSSGIVVYAGEKEGYNKTIIVQGSNGYDFWYGNLDSLDIKIYDYVKEGEALASLKEDIYLVIAKGDKFYSYDEYLNEI